MAKSLWSILACSIVLLAGVGVSNAQEKPLRIVAFGDSLTAGHGLAAKDAFPAVLERELRAGGMAVEVLNFGISGDTSMGGRSRLAPVLAAKPDGVILELGANDGLRGLAPAQMEANLETIITELQKHDIPILLTGMRAIMGMGKRYGDEFATVYSRLAQKYNLPLYPFFLEGVAGNPALNLPDMLHPNPEGVRIIVQGILPVAKAFVSGIHRPLQ